MSEPSSRDASPLREVAGGVAWLTGASLLVKPVWLGFLTFVCARVLGVEGYGVLNTALSLAALVFSFTSLGVEPYTVREVARERTRAPAFVGAFGTLRLGLSVIATLAALGVGALLGYDRVLLLAVGFACVYTAANGLSEYAATFFQAFERLRFQAGAVVLTKTLTVALAATALWLFGTPIAVLAGMAAGMTVACLGVWGGGVRKLVPRWGGAERGFIGRSLRGLLPFGLLSVLGMLFFRVDNVMVEAMLGLAAAGQYGLAFRIVEALNLLPTVVVRAATYPRLARLAARGDEGEARRSMLVAGAVLLAVSLPVAALISWTAPVLVTWIADDPELAVSAPALAILVWAFPLTALRNLYFSSLLARDDQWFVAGAVFVAVALNIGLNAALLPFVGITGAAFATIGCEAALLITYAVRHALSHRA